MAPAAGHAGMPDLLMAMGSVAHTVRGNYSACARAWSVRGPEKALSDDERSAVRRYAENGFASINAAFRPEATDELPSLQQVVRWASDKDIGDWCSTRELRLADIPSMVDRMGERVLAAANAIEGIMASKAALLPRDMAFFRGVNGADADQYSSAKTGTVIRLSAFTSVSLNPQVSRNSFMHDTGSLLVVIRARAGCPFVFVSEATTAGMGESELLLPRGLTVKVMKTTEIEDISLWRSDHRKSKMRVVLCEAIYNKGSPSSSAAPRFVRPTSLVLPLWWMDQPCAARM